MTISIATASVPGDIRTKLSAISKAGFSSIELFEPDFIGFDGTGEAFGAMVRDHGLKIDALQPFHDFEGLEGPERTLALDRLECKFDLMQALGVDMLLVCSSTHPEASGDRESIVRDLAALAERAQKRGLRIAYMALPWARHVRTEMAAFGLIREIDNPSIGLGLNSYLSLADGSKPARLRDIDGNSVFHVQLSDAPALNMDLRHLSRHFGVLPGQGDLNLAGFVRIVAKSGYAGSWSLGGLNDVRPQGDAMSVATDGYRSLVNLLDEVSSGEPDLDFPIPKLPERVYASGFEFIEFAAGDDDSEALKTLLASLCFRMERRHISKSVELWRQGAVNIVVNTEKEGFAHTAYRHHGPTVCDMGLRVRDADTTVARATALGAPVFAQPVGTGELDIPAIRGVGGNVVHFIDEKSDLHRVWDIEFDPVPPTTATQPAGIRRIDHVAETMKYEEMQSWLLYYISTFEMEKSPIVDVADPAGVVHSQAIESPEGEVRLNLNGAESGRTFAGAFLAEQRRAGVQHIALLTDDIFETSAQLEAAGFPRLRISPNYYTDLEATFGLDPGFVAKLKQAHILYDRSGRGEYFQLYSEPIFDGFFFEIVERRHGYQGFGARNAPIRLAAQMRQKDKKEMSVA
ncbi:MAG: TIM barrel protein [Alphaproteobacteria bacterium]|nr:TIM barrel protein [Alphaproteobacteria bacterium]